MMKFTIPLTSFIPISLACYRRSVIFYLDCSPRKIGITQVEWISLPATSISLYSPQPSVWPGFVSESSQWLYLINTSVMAMQKTLTSHSVLNIAAMSLDSSFLDPPWGLVSALEQSFKLMSTVCCFFKAEISCRAAWSLCCSCCMASGVGLSSFDADICIQKAALEAM